MSLCSKLVPIFFLTLAACNAELAGGDFCKIYDAVVKGSLKFTEAEARALRSITARDINELKRHYRENCIDSDQGGK